MTSDASKIRVSMLCKTSHVHAASDTNKIQSYDWPKITVCLIMLCIFLLFVEPNVNSDGLANGFSLCQLINQGFLVMA